MWPRKRLDIGWLDMASLRAAFVFRWNRRRATANVLDAWPADGQTLPTMSVRSGLHLILGQLDWPRGSEILMSAMTIPDMARIVRHHGFVPVPVDLDLNTAAPHSNPSKRPRLLSPEASYLLTSSALEAK
ncbi:MAG: hypothetical protein CM1200mP2_25000 [Planctomycetaceae bacterium]|nr:MAG: hypothetical protein CM1200mP2_25000 [Planctomycetaceae bacterium]